MWNAIDSGGWRSLGEREMKRQFPSWVREFRKNNIIVLTSSFSATNNARRLEK